MNYFGTCFYSFYPEVSSLYINVPQELYRTITSQLSLHFNKFVESSLIFTLLLHRPTRVLKLRSHTHTYVHHTHTLSLSLSSRTHVLASQTNSRLRNFFLCNKELKPTRNFSLNTLKNTNDNNSSLFLTFKGSHLFGI